MPWHQLTPGRHQSVKGRGIFVAPTESLSSHHLHTPLKLAYRSPQDDGLEWLRRLSKDFATSNQNLVNVVRPPAPIQLRGLVTVQVSYYSQTRPRNGHRS